MLVQSEKIDNNIEVSEHFQSHVKWGLLSIGFCDRMMMVMILSSCTDNEVTQIKEYLLSNNFFKQKDSSVYCRFKSRNGDYVTPEEFDKENYGIREEMTNRLIGKNKIYVEN
jgi:hypothetical protein